MAKPTLITTLYTSWVGSADLDIPEEDIEVGDEMVLVLMSVDDWVAVPLKAAADWELKANIDTGTYRARVYRKTVASEDLGSQFRWETDTGTISPEPRGVCFVVRGAVAGAPFILELGGAVATAGTETIGEVIASWQAASMTQPEDLRLVSILTITDDVTITPDAELVELGTQDFNDGTPQRISVFEVADREYVSPAPAGDATLSDVVDSINVGVSLRARALQTARGLVIDPEPGNIGLVL